MNDPQNCLMLSLCTVQTGALRATVFTALPDSAPVQANYFVLYKKIVSALAVSHAGCLRHAVSKATPMLLSHQHLVFSAAGLTRLLPCFPLSSRAKPSAQPVSVSRSRATGCITLAEFCQQNYIKT